MPKRNLSPAPAAKKTKYLAKFRCRFISQYKPSSDILKKTTKQTQQVKG
jgi:hypothetical protein